MGLLGFHSVWHAFKCRTDSSDSRSLYSPRFFCKMPAVVLRRLTRKTTVRCRIRGKRPEKKGMVIRRRISGKQRVFARHIALSVAMAPAEVAVRDEAWCELIALQRDAKRKHIHWTQVRTHNAAHKQPSQFTRKGFWLHLKRVYRETYPEPANNTGSILLFGMVAKEMHASSAKDELRDEHHHAPTYSSKQHRWRLVADHSLETYGVKMHAACHDGYASMYAYVKRPSAKKPLAELDAEVWMSKDHPRGDVLRRLLEVQEKAERAVAARIWKSASGSDTKMTRVRAGDIFHIAKEHKIRSAAQLQARAEELARGGDSSLATFCTSVGTVRLGDLVHSAWAVMNAPQNLLPPPTRMDKLRTCAATFSCTCAGVWKAGAAFVLQNNSESLPLFGRDVCRALTLGAKRGVHMAITGEPGCGKSMLFEPIDDIYEAMPAPESGSTFPLSGLLDAEVVLWQDFEYEAKTINFQDLLRLLVGEKVGVRSPGSVNIKHKNTAPVFYSAMQKIKTHTGSKETVERKNKAMDERFVIREWKVVLPIASRKPDFPKCAKCFASFMLDNDAQWHRTRAGAGGGVFL